MADDYVPVGEDEFLFWANNMLVYISANMVALGMTPAQIVPAQTALGNATNLRIAAEAAMAAAQGAVQAKQDGIATARSEMRALVQDVVMPSKVITDAQRDAMGAPVYKKTRTPVPPPTERPGVEVNTSERLRHTVEVFNSTTGKRKKPKGVLGFEVWRKVGAAPASVEELQFVALATDSSFVATYGKIDAGKTVHYWIRWVNTKGEPGPWAEPYEATIVG